MPRGETEHYFRDIFGGFSLVEMKVLLVLYQRKGQIRTEGDLRRLTSLDHQAVAHAVSKFREQGLLPRGLPRFHSGEFVLTENGDKSWFDAEVALTRALQDGKLAVSSLTDKTFRQLRSLVSVGVPVTPELDPELSDRLERDLAGTSLTKLRQDARDAVRQLPRSPASEALKKTFYRYIRGKGIDYKRAGAQANMALIETNGE